MAEVDRPGPYSREGDAEAVELHVPVGALVDDPSVHAAATAMRRRSVEAARASPVAVALTQEGIRTFATSRTWEDRAVRERAAHNKGRRPLRGTNGLQGPTSQRTTDPGLLSYRRLRSPLGGRRRPLPSPLASLGPRRQRHRA